MNNFAGFVFQCYNYFMYKKAESNCTDLNIHHENCGLKLSSQQTTSAQYPSHYTMLFFTLDARQCVTFGATHCNT